MRRVFFISALAAAALTSGAAVAVAGTLIGTEGPDRLQGTPSPDQIYGEGGDDVIAALGGSDFVEAGPGNDNVDGGGGLDLVVAGTGNDTIDAGVDRDLVYAGAGDDQVVGGQGADTLHGGGGDDVLVGGTTDFDDNLAALDALMAEWGRTDADYAARVNHLNGSAGGGLNGGYFLNSNTVHDDAALDQLYGEAGSDWFFYTASGSIKDKLNDLVTGEVATAQ
jgi:Ca2+-binding RTX toxin-like protein